MTDQELAKHLGAALEALGTIKGCALGLESIVTVELGDDYATEEFKEAFCGSLVDAQRNIEACFAASTGPVELEEAGKDSGQV